MNDEAVYRTAPATPGLLIKGRTSSTRSLHLSPLRSYGEWTGCRNRQRQTNGQDFYMLDTLTALLGKLSSVNRIHRCFSSSWRNPQWDWGEFPCELGSNLWLTQHN